MALDSSFQVERRADGPARFVSASGELDSATSPALEQEFEAAISEPGCEELTLDLRGLSFVDSAGMRTMIVIEQRARDQGIRMAVLPPPEELMEMLRVTGIAERLKFAGVDTAPGAGARQLGRVDLRLAREPLAPAHARAEVREAVGDRLPEMDMHTATLLTSELVTNAVLHSSGPPDSPIGLRITSFEDRVRVEVTDRGEGFDPAAPRKRPDGGRGLMVVDSCASRWGARQERIAQDQGFCVWFEIEPEQQGSATSVANG